MRQMGFCSEVSLVQADHLINDVLFWICLIISPLRSKQKHNVRTQALYLSSLLFASLLGVSCYDLFQKVEVACKPAAPYYRTRQLTNVAAFTSELLLISQTMHGLMGRGLKRGHSRFLLFLQDTGRVMSYCNQITSFCLWLFPDTGHDTSPPIYFTFQCYFPFVRLSVSLHSLV